MKLVLYNLVDSALKIDIWVIVAHLLAVTILLVTVIFFAWKPTKKYIDDRKQKIQAEIVNIEETKKNAELNLIESNDLRNKSIEESNKILEIAEIDAYNLKEKIKNQANIEAIHIKDMAENDIIKKEKELKENIDVEISNIAIEVAETLIKKNIDKKSNQKLIDSLIKDIKNS